MADNRDKVRLAVLTVSDRCSRGERADESGPLLVEGLSKMPAEILAHEIVPDDRRLIASKLKFFADDMRADLIVTTGGTGFGPRDVTPEATLEVVDRAAAGIPELLRSRAGASNPMAWLSRAAAGLRGRTLIINLPGHPDAVRDSLKILLPLLPHALSMARGGAHEEHTWKR